MASLAVYACSLLALAAGGHAAKPAKLIKRDTTYSTSQQFTDNYAYLGTDNQLTTVNSGVTLWFSGASQHNTYGNLNNYGQIIMSQTYYEKTVGTPGGQICDYYGTDANNGNLVNYGSISLNDYGSSSAPTYDWNLASMQNYGSLQMCGRGDNGGSTYQLYCQTTCYNYGLIDMEQYYGYLGTSFNWRNIDLGNSGQTTTTDIYNYGAFRIVNVDYQQVQNVKGNGCWILGTDSTLYLQDGAGAYHNADYGPTFAGQSIYFSDSTADLHMDTQVYSHNSNFGATVYGYGAGNAIEFYETFRTNTPVTYTASTGILSATFTSGNTVNIYIGTGYTASAFYTAANPKNYYYSGYNAIFYSGTTPSQTIPGTCFASVAVCGDPAATAGPFATATGYTTQTTAYTGTSALTGTTTQTIANPSGTAQGTVVVYTPASVSSSSTSTTSASAGTASASTASSSSIVTITVPYTGASAITAPITTTLAPGVVEVQTPVTPSVTVTLAYTGTSSITGPITSTIAPGVVAVYTPNTAGSPTTTATITVPYTGTDAITAPITMTLVPGVVEIQTPVTPSVTVTLPYTGTGSITAPITSTIAPDVVAVYTPAAAATPVTTLTLPYTGTGTLAGAITTTLAPGVIGVFTPVSTSSTTSRPSVIGTTLGQATCVCIPAPTS